MRRDHLQNFIRWNVVAFHATRAGMVAFWQRYSAWCTRFAPILVGLSFALMAATAFSIRHLHIESDFKRMLPGQYRSVIELEKIESRVRSTATLHLLVGGANWPAMRRFIDDFAAAVPRALGDVIESIDFNTHATSDFFTRNKYLYADLTDLQEVDRRLERYINYQKIKQSPLYIDLEDSHEFDIADIEAKYEGKGNKSSFRDGYYTNADATLAVMVLKPKQGATDVKFSQELIRRTRALVDTLNPSQYDPQIQTGFGGRYPKIIAEYEAVLGDARITALLCALLVSATVFFFFRRVRMCALMVGAAGLGTLCSLAVARFTIGYLTTQTAFLGSIILGNGINYALILMARYAEERRDRAHPPEVAMAIALDQTWRPTLASVATTVVSFAALMFAQIRGFSQFGMLGGLGMIFCWLATFFLLPAWLLLTEKFWPMAPRATHHIPFGMFMQPLSRLVQRQSVRVLLYSLLTAGISLIVAGWYMPRALEYDFNKLRFQNTSHQETWEAWAQSHSDDIFGQSTSPAVFLSDTREHVEPICAAIRAKAANLYTVQGKRVFDDCKSLTSFVPSDQPAKLETLARIRSRITHEHLDKLSKEQREHVDALMRTAALTPLEVHDLPDAVRERFREIDGREGLLIYVYPTAEANLWDGRELVKFANLLRRIDLPTGETIYASGEAVIFSDLLNVITHEGPLIALCSFALVILVVLLTFRGSKSGGLVIGALCLGIIWLVACLPAFGVKLNFLNFVALPIAFGIGVDYAVNVYQRYLQDGTGSMPGSVLHVGGAVLLCSLTTMLGYGVLMISRNGALRSFGLAGLLAEVACITASLVVLPAFVCWREGMRAGKRGG